MMHANMANQYSFQHLAVFSRKFKTERETILAVDLEIDGRGSPSPSDSREREGRGGARRRAYRR